MNPELLRSHIGNKHGMLIYEYANGIDRAPVEAGQADSKGYGNSVTLPSDVDSLEESDVVLLSLAESVASRLRADRVKTSCITVEIKDCHFRRSSHQRKLSVPTDITDEIVQAAKKLYRECFRGVSVRLIGLRATDISSVEFSQMDLFGDQKRETPQTGSVHRCHQEQVWKRRGAAGHVSWRKNRLIYIKMVFQRKTAV